MNGLMTEQIMKIEGRVELVELMTELAKTFTVKVNHNSQPVTRSNVRRTVMEMKVTREI